MLVIPDELSGFGIQRHGRITVQVCWRRQRDGSRVATVPGGASIRHRVRDAPENQPAHRIVATRKPPR
jgi:hypothetical protein